MRKCGIDGGGYCLFILSLLFTCVMDVAAGPLEEGLAAYKRSDWAASYAAWSPLAHKGDAVAQFYLSQLYLSGRGVERSLDQSLHWLRTSAEAGFGPAQFNMGNLYYQGQLVERDLQQSVYWWQKSAAQGIVGAQFNLANLYYTGQGVKQSNDLARYWYEKAAEQGSVPAKKALKELQQAVAVHPPQVATARSPAATKGQPLADASPVSRPAVEQRPAASISNEPAVLDWLRRQPPEGYTLQMLSLTKVEGCRPYVRRLARKYSLEAHVLLYRTADHLLRCAVLFGSFDTVRESKARIAQMPRELRKKQPWVRPFRELQALALR